MYLESSVKTLSCVPRIMSNLWISAWNLRSRACWTSTAMSAGSFTKIRCLLMTSGTEKGSLGCDREGGSSISEESERGLCESHRIATESCDESLVGRKVSLSQAPVASQEREGSGRSYPA